MFADLGVPEPELALAKAKLCTKIFETIRSRGWTQRQAAAAMGIDQPKVSEIIHGRVRSYTVDRLMGYLGKLGYGVHFSYFDLAPKIAKIRPATSGRRKGTPRAKGRRPTKATSSA